MSTLFDTGPEQPQPEPLVIELSGYALASDLTMPVTRCGEVPVINWHLDVESFRETREAVENYAEEWGDEDSKIVRVKLTATEDIA